MVELLLEIGCEELPASSVKRAYQQLQESIYSKLEEIGLKAGQSTSIGTPRRLIVAMEDLPKIQQESIKTLRGPKEVSAYDIHGKPTKALEGFCKGHGVTFEEVYAEEGYLWVKKKIPGRQSLEVLREILPEVIRSISFEKTMRWGRSRMRFARPIRWILASFGGELIPFEIEGIRSSLTSRGHRFYAPEPFEVNCFSDLMSQLRERFVEPDPKVREQRIRDEVTEIATGEPDLSQALLEENVYLTEWPKVLQGTFPEEYLTLPEPVLITAMAKHQRYFPVRDQNGKLLNQFLAVRNTGDEKEVRSGNEWVLTARFNDAKFFYEEDTKIPFHSFLEKTERISFQEKLGTVRKRAERISKLAEHMAKLAGLSETEVSEAKQAGLYAKADLSTGLVSELPSLQGIIGGHYARRAGFSESIARAIEEHYDLHKALQSAQENNTKQTYVIPAFVLAADQIDKLAGYLGLGLAPSGSSDPYGLRRAATYLIFTSEAVKPLNNNLYSLFEYALQLYQANNLPLDANKAFEHLKNLLISRYKALLSLDGTENVALSEKENRNIKIGVHDALFTRITIEKLLNPCWIKMSASILQKTTQETARKGFVEAATRVINIVQSAEKKGVSISEFQGHYEARDLDSADGEKILEYLKSVKPSTENIIQNLEEKKLSQTLLGLENLIHPFFKNTMIMVENEKIRGARLALLKDCSDLLMLAGDFSCLNSSDHH